jgi:CAI-1 autoinducer synthase
MIHDSLELALPALLRRRFDGLRGRRIAELIHAQGASDPFGVELFHNDYLALAQHSDVVRAKLTALARGDDARWMSAVFFGEESRQRSLERRFAGYLGAEDCVLAQSGYCANVGLLQAIAGPGTHVYIDECAHASLWHGVLASRAVPHRFAHNDAAALELLLRASGPGIVVVDSVYSHDGSVCPLADVVALGTRYDCVLVVDESHSLGTEGPRGAGMVAELGLAPLVHFRSASLAKAFVTRAGLVAGSSATSWLVRHASGPAIFSSACMTHDLAGLECALEVIAGADDRRERLRRNAAFLREGLLAAGYPIASRSQIVALESGLEDDTIRLRQFLEAHGVYGSVFCAPATRLTESLIRLSVNAGLGRAELERVVEVCAAAKFVYKRTHATHGVDVDSAHC